MNQSVDQRFGESSLKEIRENLKCIRPQNTINTRSSVWNQFMDFCSQRNYKLVISTGICELSAILEDWAFNMKKRNGQDYMESCIKSIWNTTAKILQEKYFEEFNISFDPFTDIHFQKAREARDAKRKLLQEDSTKRKRSAKALKVDEIQAMASSWDEETPDGLQRKVFHICAFELAWRGNEAANCKITYFREEADNKGIFTGRTEYNPIFSKTKQGGAHSCTDSKWLVPNAKNIDLCPVRLLKKLLGKRPLTIKTDRLFLTVHPNWKTTGIWFKNMPIGVNSLSKWTQISAEKIGLDTKKMKITNHSHRSSTVTSLAKNGVNEQELIKITGHANAQSIKPYLQFDAEHHSRLVDNMRGTESNTTQTSISSESTHFKDNNKILYTNCTFNIVNNYK